MNPFQYDPDTGYLIGYHSDTSGRRFDLTTLSDTKPLFIGARLDDWYPDHLPVDERGTVYKILIEVTGTLQYHTRSIKEHFKNTYFDLFLTHPSIILSTKHLVHLQALDINLVILTSDVELQEAMVITPLTHVRSIEKVRGYIYNSIRVISEVSIS